VKVYGVAHPATFILECPTAFLPIYFLIYTSQRFARFLP
jgi:hypothetical protein